MNEPYVGRFAPSPSGYMHMGNLLAMLLAWLDVRAHGGRILLRMEDLDPVRTSPDYARAIADDLAWLGLDWDEGWPEPSYQQSSRTALYEEAFHTLEEQGLVYPCWCSRAQRLAAANAPHPGEAVHDPRCQCARLTDTERAARFLSGRPPAWKVRTPDEVVTVQDGHYGTCTENLAREGGDFILRRADGIYAYQLAVSVDDMRMGVTHVVRGRDLLSSAPRQAWLIRTLGGTPPNYCHCPLLIDAGGKLSKRVGSLSTQGLRETYTPQALVGRLAYLAGLIPAPEDVTPRELIPLFDWNKVPREDIMI